MTLSLVAATFGFLLTCHFIADFLLQSSLMAKKKSEDPMVLLQHVGIHFGVFWVGGTCWGLLLKQSFYWGFGVAVVNAVLHAAIDWNIWRTYKRYAAGKQALIDERAARAGVAAEPYHFWEDHWFYVTIGFDQLLHGLSIILAVILATG